MQCDAILINPRYSKLDRVFENIGLGYVAAYSRAKGKRVDILDISLKGWTVEQTAAYLREISPPLIGVSILFQESAREVLDFIRNLRQKGVKGHIVVGGIYPSFEYQALLLNHPEIDSVCIGEGEETFYHLVECINSRGDLSGVEGLAYREGDRVVKNPPRRSVENLNQLPFPARDCLPQVLKHRNYASIVSSRGCYGRCSFCSVCEFFSSIGPKYRYRDPENIIEEIEMLIKNYGVKKFTFDDANFIGGGKRGRERAYKFARRLKDRGIFIEYSIECRANDVDKELFRVLKDSGLVRVYIGIESGSQPQLDRYAKDVTVGENLEALQILADLGIFVQMGFIMFDRDAAVEDIIANQEFIAKVKAMFPKGKLGYIYPTSRLIPLSGSSYMRKLKDIGELKGDYLGYFYDFTDKKVQMLYNISTSSSRLVWGIKRFFKDQEQLNGDFPAHWLDR